ncbi:ADP-ribosyl-[dinitrogen reductase] hydrolase [Endothiovibrio diazotrophicus]
MNLEQRAVGAYLGMAVGDALGATVEFLTPREIQVKYGTHDAITGGGWLGLKAGQVTDDTTMALALGAAIVEEQAVEAEAAAWAFDCWMRGKPVDIGNTVRRGIVHFRRTGDPESPLSEHDAGNGAAMRTLPVALFTYGRRDELMVRASRAQAHVTHHNPLSDAGTECVNRMIQLGLGGVEKLDLLYGPVQELSTAQPALAFRQRREENPSGFIVDTLRAVFQAFFDTDDFEQCLIDVVNRGGDADTTGAIAGMIAGAYYGLDGIPERWLKSLDPGVRAHCERQAVALLAAGGGR